MSLNYRINQMAENYKSALENFLACDMGNNGITVIFFEFFLDNYFL